MDYVAKIAPVPIQYGPPGWGVPQLSPLLDWVLGRVWATEFWLRASLAVLTRLLAIEPTRRVDGMY